VGGGLPKRPPNNAEKKSWADAFVDKPKPKNPHIKPIAIRCLDIQGIGKDIGFLSKAN